MSYNLYTSGPYKQANGSAITATSTNVNGGVIKAASTDSTTVTESPLGQGDNESTKVVGGIDISAADYTLVVSDAATTSNDNGLLGITYTGINNSFVAGDTVKITPNGISAFTAQIVSVSANKIVVNYPYSSALNTAITTTVDIYKATGSFATLEAGNTIMRGHAHNAHTVAVSKYQSAESQRDMNHRMQSLRTTRTATAIRAGYWLPTSGAFSTAPTTANDYAGMDIDGSNVPDDETKQLGSSNKIGGEFTYRGGQPTATSKDYETRS